jgi:hypothetical protein
MKTSIKILILLIMVFNLSFMVLAIPNTAISTTSKDTVISSGVPTAPVEVKKFFYDSKGRPDHMENPLLTKEVPTTEAGNKPEAPVQINPAQVLKEHLSGIIFAEDSPMDSIAIVNGKFVKTGNVIKIPALPKSIKINKIKREELTVLYDNKIYNVSLISKSN